MGKNLTRYYSPSRDRDHWFTEKVTKQRWFQASDWQPYEPETPGTIKKEQELENEDVVINNDEFIPGDALQNQSEPQVVIGNLDQTEKKEDHIPTDADDDMIALTAKYEKVFGKKPHHKMKPETIKQKLNQYED